MGQATDVFKQVERLHLENKLLRQIYAIARLKRELLEDPDFRDAIALYEKEFVDKP